MRRSWTPSIVPNDMIRRFIVVNNFGNLGSQPTLRLARAMPYRRPTS